MEPEQGATKQNNSEYLTCLNDALEEEILFHGQGIQ